MQLLFLQPSSPVSLLATTTFIPSSANNYYLILHSFHSFSLWTFLPWIHLPPFFLLSALHCTPVLKSCLWVLSPVFLFSIPSGWVLFPVILFSSPASECSPLYYCYLVLPAECSPLYYCSLVLPAACSPLYYCSLYSSLLSALPCITVL